MKFIQTALRSALIALPLLWPTSLVAQTPQELAAPVIAGLPKPEEPVFLPSDEEVAQHMANRRTAWLQYLQHDPDGWDDLWVLIQKSDDKNYQFDPNDKAKDTDGDGFSDYEEMLSNRDATRKEPVYTKAQQIEQIREARRQSIRGAVASAEEQFRVRAIFAPWMHQDVPSAIPGKAFSIEVDTQEKRQRLGQSLPALAAWEKDQFLAGKAAASRIGLPHRFKLPGGGDAVVVGESNGMPELHYTRNSGSADTISADNLWPGGSSGLNLSGTDVGQPSVRLGVWGPSGAFLEHNEFGDAAASVDEAEATTSWAASSLGSVALNTTPGDCFQGAGCLDLRKTAGSPASALYSKTQGTSADFTGRTLLVWYFIANTNVLATTGAVELRYGSGSGAYWSRSYSRAQLGAGWNQLSLEVATATGTTGSPVLTACNYTALNITYTATTTAVAGNSQGMDYWHLVKTKTVDALDSNAGWSAGSLGTVALNSTVGDCRQGTGCLDLRKTAGSPTTVLYSKTQAAASDFTGRTLLVWYYIDNPFLLAEFGAVQLRYGSGSGAYWFRTYDRLHLLAGWNYLSFSTANATDKTGSPVLTGCTYTALNIAYASTATSVQGNIQTMDHWRLATTRVLTMDRATSLADHSSHVTGTLAAQGAQASAKGIAYTAGVHSRDSFQHMTELSGIFSNSDPADDLFVSSHSYGPDPGWSFRNEPSAVPNFPRWNATTSVNDTFTLPAGTHRWWDGTLATSSQEDFKFGLYRLLSQQIDGAVYSSGTILPVWAAGNDRAHAFTGFHLEVDPAHSSPTFGNRVWSNAVRPADGGATGYDTMPEDSVAKNILTVGSTADLPGGFAGTAPTISIFSNYGPTDDGRIKPDVCACGESVYSPTGFHTYSFFDGTSQAAPSVGGTLGLLVELLQRYRTTTYQPPASLLKGLIIHTADEMLTAGPDYRSGWGLVNAQKAADLVVANETGNRGANLRMVLIPNGTALSLPVVSTGAPLRVTACWTDPKGTPPGELWDPATLMLVNDINIQVTTSGAGPFNPFVLDKDNPANAATTGTNTRDNVEQVLISAPVAGHLYNISIGRAAGETLVNDLGQAASQMVAVLITGVEPAPVGFRIEYFLQTSTTQYTVVWGAVVGNSYRVQTSPNMASGTWTDVTGDIQAALPVVAREVTFTATEPRRFWRVRQLP